MVKKNISKFMSILLFILSFNSLNSQNYIHTIYIMGPNNKKNWFKESKNFYQGLKLATKKTSNSIEIFPQKNIAKKIFLNKKEKLKRKFKKTSLGKISLITFYNNFDFFLVTKLVNLIKKRYKEINDKKGPGCKINLISYGRGVEILKKALEMINMDKEENKIKTATAIESPKYQKTNPYKDISEIQNLDYQYDSECCEVESEPELELEKEQVEMANETLKQVTNELDAKENEEHWISKLKIEGKKADKDKTIVYVTINQVKEDVDENDFWEPGQKCTMKKFIVTAGALVGIATTLATLL